MVGTISVTGCAEQIAGVAANQQDGEKDPADDGHGEERLEQRVGDELHDDNVPIRGGDEHTAPETVFQRQGQRADVAHTTVRDNSSTACRCPISTLKSLRVAGSIRSNSPVSAARSIE